jgi:hypothetical protein
VNSSLPVPPVATSGAWMPGLSQPRVVAISTGNVSCGSSAPSSVSRLKPKICPIWNASLPSPPSSVVIALLSST